MIHPILVVSARLGVEKRAASLGDIAARSGAAVGHGVGTVLGGQAQNVLRYAPTALGAAGGALIGSRRPDISGQEKPTRGQRLRGALVGGAVGAGLGHMSGVGQGLSKSFAEKAAPMLSPQGQLPFGGAPSFTTPQQASQSILGAAGESAGRYLGEVPGRVGRSVVSGAKLVGHTVTNPIESVENVAQAAWDPLKSAVRTPGTIKEHLMQQATNPIGALMLGLEGKRAIDNLATTEDPSGRQRGLGERVLGSAGNLAGGIAYGAYQGPASANNAITRFVGSSIGSKAVGSGTAALGRKIDTLRGFKGNAGDQLGDRA